MKLITYRSYGTFSNFGIEHSVLVEDGYVLSYEMETIIGKGEFHVYTYTKWKESINEKGLEFELPNIDIRQYAGRKEEGLLCYEAIELILKEKGIMLPDTLKIKWKSLLFLMFLTGIYTILVMFLTSIYWYTVLTVSEEDYINDQIELCQE